MGVSISVALLNQIDKYLVVGFYGNILYAYYSNNNSIASGLFTMISVGIMRGVYPAVLRGWREGGKAAAKPLLDQGVRLYLLIAVPAVAGLIIAGEVVKDLTAAQPVSVPCEVRGRCAGHRVYRACHAVHGSDRVR